MFSSVTSGGSRERAGYAGLAHFPSTESGSAALEPAWMDRVPHRRWRNAPWLVASGLLFLGVSMGMVMHRAGVQTDAEADGLLQANEVNQSVREDEGLVRSGNEAEAEEKLEAGAAALVSHLFDDPSTSTTSLGAREERDDAAEQKLEAGAAAFASHWFGEDTTTLTTTASPSNSSSMDTLGSMAEANESHDWYRVYIQTIVRENVSMDSPQVSVVPPGVFVHVVEKQGRRVRVDKAGSDLTRTQHVAGWLSLKTADESITILRPVAADELPKESHAHTLAESLRERTEEMKRRREADAKAKEVAKVTIYQRAVTDNLQKVDPNKTAKSIAYFSQHREAVEQEGVHQAEKAGEHVVDTLAKGADALLGKLDKVAEELSGDDDDDDDDDGDDGTPVQPLSVDIKKGPIKDIFGFLKKELG